MVLDRREAEDGEPKGSTFPVIAEDVSDRTGHSSTKVHGVRPWIYGT